MPRRSPHRRGTPGSTSAYTTAVPVVTDGTWQIQVTRFAGEGEFPVATRRRALLRDGDGGWRAVFSSAASAPLLHRGHDQSAKVVLREPSGFLVHAEVTLDVEVPQEGTGNILTQQTGLRAASEKDGDAVDSRASTLIALEKERGLLIPVTTQRFELVDDGELDGDGALEPDSVFGNALKDLTRFEGNYTFHAVATFGEGCTGTRETTWTTYVSVGIDPGRHGRQDRPGRNGPGGPACCCVRR